MMMEEKTESTSSVQVEVTDPKHLTTIYKKNGTFDKQRKELLESFKTSKTCENLLLKLRVMIESKVKNDPSILMKNKGKMAALILGEIVNPNSGNMQSSSGETTNTTPNNSNSSSNGNSNNIATAAPTARSEDSILSIVDKDIQEKIIDSSEFHNSLKIELMDVRRKLLGISDEEFERMKAEERAKFEKQEEEAIAEKLKLEQEREENETRSFFQGKSFNNGTNVSSSNYRVGKPMTSHYRNGDDKSAQEKNERKKKDKVPVMMY